MSETRLSLLERLRSDFDHQFASPVVEHASVNDHFLGFRVVGRAYAVSTREIGGVEAVRKIVPLPAPSDRLIGLSGIRGHLVPIYSLAVLLGHSIGDERPRWVLLSQGKDIIGLAFSQLDGLLEVSRSAQVEDVLQTHGLSRSVIRIETLVARAREG